MTDYINNFLTGATGLFDWHLQECETPEFKEQEAAQRQQELESARPAQAKEQRKYRKLHADHVAMRRQAAKYKPALRAQQCDLCYWCKQQLLDDCEIDHIIPLSKAGTNDPSNLCVCHARCNRKKAARLMRE